jgi:Flp pilus assembly protein TadD
MLSAGPRVLSHLISAAVFLAALLAVSSYAQAPPQIPPDVQAIMNKLSAGGTPTPQEQQRLQSWGQSMAKGMSSAGAASGGASQSPGTPGSLGLPFQGQASNGKISFTQLCPKPSSAALPSTAPTAAEYLALVKTLAARYGAKLDLQTRVALDSGVTQAGANAGSLPALLVPAGAINEAVYAGSVAAQRNPLDVNAANNLGVSLDQAADYPDAARVLLYLTSLRPQSPLAAVNLAWVDFNAGSSAAAKKQFVHAQGLGPDMAAPEEGQGLIAGCQGDLASAKTLLGSSLKKGYSTAGAVGFMAAQQAQPSSATDAGWTPPESEPPPNADSMIPDLKVPDQMQYSPAYAAALMQVNQQSQSRLADLGNQMMAAYQRIVAINQRFQQQGDSVINLPLTFEAELFEFKEVVNLSYYARFRNMDQVNKQVTQAMNANLDTTVTTMSGDSRQYDQLSTQMTQMQKEADGCGPNNGACWEKYEQQLKDVMAQMDQLNYQTCLHSKQSIDGSYIQTHKLWKAQWDDFRPASADLYAFTDPILKKVWVPAVYDFLSLWRETTVYSLYTPLSGAAAGLVKMGDAYKDMKCVPPPPKETKEEASPPDLPKETPPPCPLGNGIGFGLLVVSVHLGCDSASIEGGEALRFKASRNFAAHSTTLWAGVGAGASVGVDAPMLGSLTPKASLSVETGFGVILGQGGTISDEYISSDLSAKLSAGNIDTGPISLPQPGTSIGMGASGVYSLENGASLSGNIAGFGGTIHQ